MSDNKPKHHGVYACYECGRTDLHTQECPCGGRGVWVPLGLPICELFEFVIEQVRREAAMREEQEG